MFPTSDHAVDVVDTLIRYMKRSGVEMLTGKPNNCCWRMARCRGRSCRAAHAFWPGMCWLRAAVCRIQGRVPRGMAMRLHVRLAISSRRCALVGALGGRRDGLSGDDGTVAEKHGDPCLGHEKKKEIYHDFGEMLFTHFGLSGPMVLSASAHMRDMAPDRYRVVVDLKPALRPEQLDARLQRDFEANKNRDFSNALSALLPRKMIPVMVRRSGIAPDTKCNQITREQRRALRSF